MKSNDKQTMQKMSVLDLQKEVASLEGQWKKLRTDRYVKEQKNSRESKNIRKKIAVLMTYIKEKQLISEK